MKRGAEESSADARCSVTNFVPPLIRRCKPIHIKELKKKGRWPAGATQNSWVIRFPTYVDQPTLDGAYQYMTDSKQCVMAFEYLNDAAQFLDDQHRSIGDDQPLGIIAKDYIFCFPNNDQEARSGLSKAPPSFKMSTMLTTDAQVATGTRCTATGACTLPDFTPADPFF